MAIFPGEPMLAGFIEAKDGGSALTLLVGRQACKRNWVLVCWW